MHAHYTRLLAIAYGMLVLSTVAAVGSPSAAQDTAGTRQQVELANPALASTATMRHQLTYLVRCALPADVELYTQQGTERFTFPGQMGLAPRWLSEAMTPSEERWVSACLLALTNALGKHVTINMRASRSLGPTGATAAEESQTFSIFEGGFFGNLFLPHPVAYTCRGERTPAQAGDPIFQDRVCTQDTSTTKADGTPITACRFLLIGRCEDDASFTIDGTPYTEVIFTYLAPSMRK